MRTTARKASWIAVATTVMALLAPVTSAHADYGDTLKGGCGFATVGNATLTSGANTGLIYDVSLSQEQNGLPSGADVQCWIEVNGEIQPGTWLLASGSGVQENHQQISFNAFDGDIVSLCQSVSFWDPSTWTAPDGNVGTDCQAATSLQFPPQAIYDFVNTLVDSMQSISDPVIDPIVCPIFSELYSTTGGGVLGVLLIQPDGDLYLAKPLGVGYDQVYDCPPYGNGTGTEGFQVGPTIIYFRNPPTL